jgi:preprotein translocase subunit SecD
MNQYPLWKYAIIVVVVVFALIYSAPNLFGEDPAVQVSGSRTALVDAGTRDKVRTALKSGGIPVKRIEINNDRLLVRFTDTETRLLGVDVIKKALSNDYVVALNSAPATPGWLEVFNAAPMYYGLDLRGGVHFLLEVDMAAAIEKAYERYAGDLRSLMRREKVRYRTVDAQPSEVRIEFTSAEERDKADDLVGDEYSELVLNHRETEDRFILDVRMGEDRQQAVKEFALEQNITTLRNRVNELGVAEPVIQQEGDKRIVVELPGLDDTARAKEILGATATLEFRLVDTEHDPIAAQNGRVPPTAKLYRERNGTPILLKRRVIVTGDQITNAASGLEQRTGSPAVFITLDGMGGKKMNATTRENIGKPMAVVFIENKTDLRTVDGERVRTSRKVEEVINVATIRDQFSKRFQITGLDSTQEARNLALLLRAGALAAPIDIVEERTVGPSLGKDNVEQGFWSVIVGFVLVLIFIAFYYRGFGLVADLALAFNLVLLVAILSMLQATLTLPGIAGIVLTVGMAVDANVLIYERIREELHAGNTPQASIHAGYEKALSTIADANITTLIAAVLLFSFGTGPIKGFAVTLSIGILTSMFTAIMGTRAVVNLVFGGRRLQSLPIG